MSTNIYDLPEEVLQFLFSKLSFSDRKLARLVSKQWLQVCNSSSITKHEIIKVTKDKLEQFTIPRGNLNLQVYCMKDPRRNLNFWRKHGTTVRTLKLSGVELRFSELIDIMRFCPNMENLELSYYYAFNTGLSKKKGRKLRLIVDVTEEGFLRLNKRWPKLKQFTLKGCNIVGHKEAVIQTTMSFSVSATEIFFNGCSFTTLKLLETIVEKNCHQLTGLYLELGSSCINTWIDQYLPTISKKLIKLENLKLDYGCSDFTLVSDFLMSLRNLKLVSLRESDITDDLLLYIAGFEHLKGLDISDYYHGTLLTTHGFIQAFGKREHLNLIDVRFTNLDCVTNDVLVTILPQMPNLEYLDLSCCKNISEKGVSAIVTNCKQLNHLSLESCFKIRTLMEPISINNLKSLVHLNLFGCFRLPVSQIVKELKLDLLKTIEFDCNFFPRKNLKTLMVNSPSLQRVHLFNSDGVATPTRVEEKLILYEDITRTCKFSRGYRPLKTVSIFDFSTRLI